MEGHSLSKIEEMSRVSPVVTVIKRETLARHRDSCLKAPGVKPKQIAEVAKVVTKGRPVEDDVAVLVQAEVVKKLKDGEARVTVQHGLQAQALLDRRAERAKDRELAVTLARLLHAPPPPAAAIMERVESVTVIEGEVVEVG
jgi:hypothetical protein